MDDITKSYYIKCLNEMLDYMNGSIITSCKLTEDGAYINGIPFDICDVMDECDASIINAQHKIRRAINIFKKI